MRILGIETSCDETAAAVVEGKNPPNPCLPCLPDRQADRQAPLLKGGIKVLSNVVSSQIEIHKKYGGVVPEVAAREHVLNILPVVDKALAEVGIKISPTLFLKEGKKSPQSLPTLPTGQAGGQAGPLAKGGKIGLDAIAVTIGPGLITSLVVGIETAKVLSYAWNIPVIGVNHIEGHIYANFISSRIRTNYSELNIKFPALILTVSGGHTMLVLMRGHGQYKTIGETRDDAAGEAFDKAAAMMGIGYPGGPIISEYARQFKKKHPEIFNFQFSTLPAGRQVFKQFSMSNKQFSNKSQIPNPKSQISLPRPMINSKDYDFSFSGLKTALLYELKKNPNYKSQIPNYCHEFQQAVIDVLIHKTIKAAKDFKVKTIMLSGGVAANLELRKQLAAAVKFQVPSSKFKVPSLKYTTDNAAMIAAAGYYKALRKQFIPWQKLQVDCNAEL